MTVPIGQFSITKINNLTQESVKYKNNDWITWQSGQEYKKRIENEFIRKNITGLSKKSRIINLIPRLSLLATNN